MAERVAILGGEPFEEWIKRNGPAQRMYKAYTAKWPDSDAACFVALITPHGCLKWLEGEPIEYSRGVWVSNMYWNI